MTALTTRSFKRLEKLHRDYALRDAKGREIGGAFDISEATYSPAPEGALSGWHHAAGTFIIGCPHATRNGAAFGASQPSKEYPSIEAAREAAEVYFANAAKRAGRS